MIKIPSKPMHAHAEKPPEKVWIRWEPEEEKEREKKKSCKLLLCEEN
jgi:hypothetical protein